MEVNTTRLVDTVPTGGDPDAFCECLHHEMNHANYHGMQRKCNQTGCECNGYTPAKEHHKRLRDLLEIELYMRDEGGDKYAAGPWDALQRLITYQREYITWWEEQQRKFDRWKAQPDGPQAA